MLQSTVQYNSVTVITWNSKQSSLYNFQFHIFSYFKRGHRWPSVGCRVVLFTWTVAGMSEWMSEWVSECVSEWVWVSEWVPEWVRYSTWPQFLRTRRPNGRPRSFRVDFGPWCSTLTTQSKCPKSRQNCATWSCPVRRACPGNIFTMVKISCSLFGNFYSAMYHTLYCMWKTEEFELMTYSTDRL